MKKAYIKKEKTKKICPVCNKEFWGKEGQISCSNHCSQLNYSRLHPKPKKDRYRLNNPKRDKICPFCNISFRDNSRQNNMEYCCEEHSKKCYKNNIFKPRYFELNKIYCIICNAYFLPSGGVKSDLPICSKQCVVHHLTKFNELGYILGVIASDGFLNDKQMGMTVKDKDYAEKFQFCLKKIFPSLEFKLCTHSDGRFRVYCTRLKIVQALNLIFESKTKTYNWIVPKIILNNKEMARQFLGGFFDGEGTVMGKKYISIQGYSVNKDSLNTIAELLNNFNIKSTYSKLNRKNKPFFSIKDDKIYYGKEDIHVIAISKLCYVKRFYEEIGFKIKRKSDKLKEYIEKLELINPQIKYQLKKED